MEVVVTVAFAFASGAADATATDVVMLSIISSARVVTSASTLGPPLGPALGAMVVVDARNC